MIVKSSYSEGSTLTERFQELVLAVLFLKKGWKKYKSYVNIRIIKNRADISADL